jgi:hypothetical protein
MRVVGWRVFGEGYRYGRRRFFFPCENSHMRLGGMTLLHLVLCLLSDCVRSLVVEGSLGSTRCPFEHHLRGQAAAIWPYHRLQYTQMAAIPVREQSSTCTISVFRLQLNAYPIGFSTLKRLLCQ